jgi:hypothetical protein
MLLIPLKIGASNRVVAYTVHEPPEISLDPAERAEQLTFVKDGISWAALFFAPIWLLAKRFWLALLVYVVVAIALGGGLTLLELGPSWGVLAYLGLNLFVALEADSIQRWSLDRKGWHMIGSVSGATTRECERRFFERWLAEEVR